MISPTVRWPLGGDFAPVDEYFPALSLKLTSMGPPERQREPCVIPVAATWL